MNRTLPALGAVVLAMTAGGCASLYNNEAVPVVIEDRTPDVRYVKNRNDPVEVVQFARTLSITGKNRDAARIYLDAAERFESVDGKFEADCRKEAVREYWMAGDYDQARNLFQELDTEQDIYRRAADDENLERLRQLLKTSTTAKK